MAQSGTIFRDWVYEDYSYDNLDDKEIIEDDGLLTQRKSEFKDKEMEE